MPLIYDEQTVRAEGTCGVEEAPQLLEWLEAETRHGVDLRQSTHLHTAIVQALTEARLPVSAAPDDPFLARWVAPLLPASAS